ncbi:xylose isomerase-like protein [Pavlovales sp. CCMP2436]|nr:xylose isomerase-like protein [Pavlovales sp. CCMP2436]
MPGGHIECVRLLLSASSSSRADMNQAEWGTTALMCSVDVPDCNRPPTLSRNTALPESNDFKKPACSFSSMPEVGVRLRPLAIAQGALAELAKARSERLAAEGAMVPLKRARFAANLAMLYAEHPFLHRFRHAAAAGFRAVEISHPEMYAHAPEALAAELEKHQLTCELFNMPPGDWSGGERGIGALAGREADFDASVRSTIEYARALKCPRVHCLSGLVEPGAESDAVYRRSLRRALDALAPLGVDVLIEPINQRSIPDFYLRDFEQVSLACFQLRPRLRLPSAVELYDTM